MGWRPAAGGDPLPQPEPALLPYVSAFAARTPAIVLTEAQAYELGTRILVSKDGTIEALQLYRTNSTAQTMRLWKNGQVVATAPIPGGAAGWVQSDPISVPAVAGDLFIVSVSKSGSQSVCGG